MAIADWLIVLAYLMISLVVGLYFTKRAGTSLEGYFVANRSLVWWLAGTSIVATTFSSDTPLFVAGLVRTMGVYENWFWWSQAFGGLISVFFFSRLWRRTEARTDVEFIHLRYEGKPAEYLRYFMALYKGIFFNLFILASVTLAVSKLATAILGLNSDPLFVLPLIGPITSVTAIITGLAFLTFFYTILSGLYGVVYTDLIQFILAMVGSISLAVFAWFDAGPSKAAVMEKLTASSAYHQDMLNFFPSFESFDLKVLTFIVYIGVLWWGMAPGYAYQIQRLLACRTEKDALLANLWYNLMHYAVRSWPWIIVGILSIIYFPNLADPEMAYPEMINKFLPVGLKGIMVASLLAAYMSTINTLLNWGSSYVVNDFIQPLKPGLKDKTYVTISRITGAVLAVLTVVFATQISSIIGVYKYVAVMESGAAIILVLRWYWWRVNAWTEISAYGTSLLIANILNVWSVTAPPANGYDKMFPIRILITTVITAVVWISVMFRTSGEPSKHLIAFYKKVGIGGSGWKRVAALFPDIKVSNQNLKTDFFAYLMALVFIFSILFTIGKLLFGGLLAVSLGVVVCLLSGVYLLKSLKRIEY